MVQLNFTPEIEVFYMQFERCLSNFIMASQKQHIESSQFRSKIQLELPVAALEVTLARQPVAPRRPRVRVGRHRDWVRRRRSRRPTRRRGSLRIFNTVILMGQH